MVQNVIIQIFFFFEIFRVWQVTLSNGKVFEEICVLNFPTLFIEWIGF